MYVCMYVCMYVNPVKAQVNGNYAPNPEFTDKYYCPRFPNWSYAGTNLLDPYPLGGIYSDVLPSWRDVGEAIHGGSATGSLYMHPCNTEPCGPDLNSNYFGFQQDRLNDSTSGYMLLSGSTGYRIDVVPKPPKFSGLDTVVPQCGTNRSYITTLLPTPLQAGKTYEVSFYVSLAEASTLAVNNFGMLFTNDRLPIGQNAARTTSPIIELGVLDFNFDYFLSPIIVTDRQNWVKISGTVSATDNYDWVTIGVFDDSYSTSYPYQVPAYLRLPAGNYCNKVTTGSYTGYPGFAYYLDDVGIYEQPNPAFTYNTIGALCDLVEFNAIATFNQPWYNHTWKLLSGTTLIDTKPTGNNPTVIFTGIPAGTYTLVHEVVGYGATYSSQQTITISGYNHATYTSDIGFQTWTANNNPINGGSGRTGTVKDLLLIPSNSHIIVDDMEILFGPNAKLVIEPGASFTANNSTFNVNEECAAIMWNGIEVWGKSDKPQGAKPTDPDQGYLELKNCTLTNAYTGVYVGKKGSLCSGGGVVRIIRSEFTNNKVHLKMVDYIGVDNKSFLLSNLFQSTDYLRDGSGIVVQNYIELNNVRRLKLNKCRFETQQIAGLVYNNRGSGIYAINSSVFAFPLNKFKNLYTAIRLVGTGRTASTCRYYYPSTPFTTSASNITSNLITDCYRGIWANNKLGENYSNNTIHIDGKLRVDDPEESIGIFVENCSPINIVGNTLSLTNTDGYGIVVRNGATYGTVVESNTFNGLGIGLQHDENNKIAFANCNEFTGNFTDWNINPELSKEPLTSGVYFPIKQGECFQGGLSGNQFYDGCAPSSQDHIRSYVSFDYATNLQFIPTIQDPTCKSNSVNVFNCNDPSSPICSSRSEDPTQLDNTLRNTIDPYFRSYLLSKIISLKLSDSVDVNLKTYLENHNATLTEADKKLLIQSNLVTDNLVALQNLITTLSSSNAEDAQFVSFYTGLLSRLNSGFRMDSLGGFVSELENYATQKSSVSDLAKGILETYYNATFIHNPNQLIGDNNRQAMVNTLPNNTLLYPNPVDKLVTLEHELLVGDRLILYSRIGGKLNEDVVIENSSVYSFNTADLASGMYFLQIQKKNGKIETLKFVVLH